MTFSHLKQQNHLLTYTHPLQQYLSLSVSLDWLIFEQLSFETELVRHSRKVRIRVSFWVFLVGNSRINPCDGWLSVECDTAWPRGQRRVSFSQFCVSWNLNASQFLIALAAHQSPLFFFTVRLPARRWTHLKKNLIFFTFKFFFIFSHNF
jgi:hypothetical protein